MSFTSFNIFIVTEAPESPQHVAGNCGLQGSVTPVGDRMTDEKPTAAYYRDTAENLRKLAGTAQLPEVRRELLELAERFDRLAEYLEKTDPSGRGKAPP